MTPASPRTSSARSACMSRRPTRSRPPALGWPTESGCAGPGAECSPASSFARRSTRSTTSAPRRGPTGARAERAATGETRRPRDASGINELTPQELQIALLLAGGKTTRETAAALFLSPKTVEYHLRHVYQRLGIHSRDELAERMRHASPAD